MNKQTQNIINVSLTLIAIYLYSFTANNIETEILGFNSFKFLISIAVLIQFLIFLPSFIFKSEKFYDLTGSLTRIHISVTSIAYFSLDNPRQLIRFFFFMLLFGLEDLEYSSLEELTKLVKMYDLIKLKRNSFGSCSTGWDKLHGLYSLQVHLS